MSNQLIYVLEDNKDICFLYQREFPLHGYQVETFGTISEFINALKSKQCDLCIMDLSLPDGDALITLKNIITEYSLPCIIVSGRGSTSDKVLGLEFGAEDYMVKPVDMLELIARAKTVLRRYQNSTTNSKIYQFAGWKADLSTLKLTGSDQREHNLSLADKDLLKAFLDSKGKLLSREILLDICQLENHDIYDRSIDVRVSRLRKKLNSADNDTEFIKTIYGAGYLFVPKVKEVKN